MLRLTPCPAHTFILSSSDDEDESSDDEGEEVAALASPGGVLMLPSLPGDRLRKADAMPSDVMHGIVNRAGLWRRNTGWGRRPVSLQAARVRP